MPTSLFHAASRLAAGAHDARTDAHLVAAFLRDADQDAFAELVRRHGPAVLGVCRRFLGPTPDAEDAFQATFLVLVRRARGTEWRASLGPWLYGVALRVARKARAVRAKRRANERQATVTPDAPTPPADPDDAATALDDELAALPAAYRLPLVLCEIQGASRRAAARELGIAEGTLSSRLARGRKLLRDRLARRGVVPAVAGLAAAVPAPLATATVRNAVDVLTRAAEAVPAGVLSLTEGVVKTMIVKWKLATVTVAACLGLTGFGTWQTSAQPAPASITSRPMTAPAVPPEKAAPEKAPAAKPPEPVATIYGNVPISREAFADHLIRRYGKKELQLFVNKQIVAHALAQKGWTITPAEVEAALDETCTLLKMTRAQLAAEILKNTGKTLEEWNEDMNVPSMMIARLCKAKVPAATEAELRQAFDLKYGEKLDCRIIVWARKAEAQAAYEKVRDSENEFDAHARRCPEAGKPRSGVAADGRVAPLARAHPLEDHEGEQAIHDAIAKLQPGQVSRLITAKMEGGEGFVVLKCDRVIPADKGKSFETEKTALLADVMNAKIGNETPKLHKELMKEADPKYHLTFPVAPPEQVPGAVKPPEPVATIYSDVKITREVFADHLIARYGKKELELFVNKQIVARAFAQKGWTIKAAEVQAALDEDCKSLGLTRAKFTSDVLPRYGKTPTEWAEDVIEPRLMLGRLMNEKARTVTEAELRQAFDTKYGEKVQCRVVAWGKDEGDAARAAAKKIAAEPAAFDFYARNQSNGNLKATGGRTAPLSRTPKPDADKAYIAGAKLDAGEVSPLVPTDTGFVLFKCDGVTPADTSKSFETEKPMLLTEVVEARLNREMPKLFAELKQQADPKYHLTFPDPVAAPKQK